MKIVVIGGCNIDIIGVPKKGLIDHESNIGDVSITLGGVAKNIATNLYYLDSDISFITLIGNDSLSKIQVDSLDKLGIDYSKSIRKPCKSSTYLALHDATGEMTQAINDMQALEALTEKDFYNLDDFISKSDLLVLDTNLSESTLTYLIDKYQDKYICVDGVSQTKVVRIKNVLKYIDLLKINKYELNALLNNSNCDIIFGVKQLLEKGLVNCIVSQAKEPIVYNESNKIFQFETTKIENIKSTTGAGDALFSGIIYYLANGKDIHEAVKFGENVATETLKVLSASNKDIKKLIDL